MQTISFILFALLPVSNFTTMSPAEVTSRAMMYVYRKCMCVEVQCHHCIVVHGISFTSHDVSDKSSQNFDMMTVLTRVALVLGRLH